MYQITFTFQVFPKFWFCGVVGGGPSPPKILLLPIYFIVLKWSRVYLGRVKKYKRNILTLRGLKRAFHAIWVLKNPRPPNPNWLKRYLFAFNLFNRHILKKHILSTKWKDMCGWKRFEGLRKLICKICSRKENNSQILYQEKIGSQKFFLWNNIWELFSFLICVYRVIFHSSTYRC